MGIPLPHLGRRFDRTTRRGTDLLYVRTCVYGTCCGWMRATGGGVCGGEGKREGASPAQSVLTSHKGGDGGREGRAIITLVTPPSISLPLPLICQLIHPSIHQNPQCTTRSGNRAY